MKRLLLTILLGAVASLGAQTRVTTPKQQFGFDLGDDYQLANYTQIAEYWGKLDAESDRMLVQAIGTTSEGRPHLMAIVARDLGVSFVPATLSTNAIRLRAPRIALFDRYGGSMESGWTRWILEQFEFPFERVFAPQLDAGGLNAKYDVLIIPSGGIPAAGPAAGGRGGRGGGAGPDPQDIPAEYRSQLGRVTPDRTIPQLTAFIENGGTVIAISDSAMNLAGHLGLPVENHLTENGLGLPLAKYFVPGSVLTGRVDTTHPLAAGMRDRTDFFFDNSPVFRIRPGAAGLRPLATFDTATPLRSGWAWGQKYLEGGVLAVEATMGKGRVLLYGPEILQRAQPHGTFKLLFNGIYSSVAAAK